MTPPTRATTTTAVSLPADEQAPAAARRAIRRRLGHGSTAEIAEVLVSELVTNVLRHRECSTGDHLSLEITTDPHGCRVAVRSSAGPARGDDRDERSGGFGLLLVDRLAEAWGLEAGGDRVHAWFRLAATG